MFAFLTFVFFLLGFMAPPLWIFALVFALLGACANKSRYGSGR